MKENEEMKGSERKKGKEGMKGSECYKTKGINERFWNKRRERN